MKKLIYSMGVSLDERIKPGARRDTDVWRVTALSSGKPGQLHQVLSEEGTDKPDIEALTLLPPFERHPYGALLGLGSGSSAKPQLSGQARGAEHKGLANRS